MKRSISIVLVIGIVALIAVVISTGNSSDNKQSSVGQEANMTTEATLSLDSVIASGEAVLLDVRTPEEYNEAHFEGAILLPLQDIEAGAVPTVGTDETIYLYCRSGNRSAQAKELLEAKNYQVVDLGGLDDVLAVGGNLVPGSCPMGDLVCMNQAIDG